MDITAKRAAYAYLTLIGLPDDYLKQCQRDFETGDIFWRGLPAYSADARMALAGVASRMSRVATELASAPRSPELEEEASSLEALGSMVLTSFVPACLGWEIDAESHNACALLLGHVWIRNRTWLVYWIKRRDCKKTNIPEIIAADLLVAPMNEFETEPWLPCAPELAKWLASRIEWQVRKERRELSLDASLSDDSGDATFADIMPDPDADEAIVNNAERGRPLAKLSALLSPQEKAAIEKYRTGVLLSATERRTMNRGIRRIQDYLEERGTRNLD